MRTARALAVSNRYVDDVELVERAQQGDQSAFTQLVVRYQKVAVGTAFAALGSAVEADDVAQEAFLLAHRKLVGFRRDASFKTWLLTIVWRRAFNRRRGMAHRLRVWLEPEDARWSQATSLAASTEEVLIDRQLREHLRRLVVTLPPKLRDALLVGSSGHHTVQEAAAILGVPEGTVKSRASSARRLLKRKLAGLGYAAR